MTTNENETKTGKTRNRRTRAQLMEDLRAKLAKLEAQAQGTFDEASDDGYLVKRLKRAIRRRETVLGNAETLLMGRKATEKSPAIGGIDEKIANAKKRLADMELSKTRALEMQARVPFDIDILRETLGRVEAGENLDFPDNLYVLPGETDKTDAEREAAVGNPERGTDD